MDKNSMTFNDVPQALSLLLEKVTRLESLLETKVQAPKAKQDELFINQHSTFSIFKLIYCNFLYFSFKNLILSLTFEIVLKSGIKGTRTTFFSSPICSTNHAKLASTRSFFFPI